MPSQGSFWLLTEPLSGTNDQSEELEHAIGADAGGSAKLGELAPFKFPEFKTGTLSSLLTLSESLVKHDAVLTSTFNKITDTIRSLVSSGSVTGSAGEAGSASEHFVMDDGRPYEEYLFNRDQPWEWNKGKFRVEAMSLMDIVDAINKDASGIDNAQRNKSQQYNVVKGQLNNALRKKTGNLSTRALGDIVKPEDFADTNDSEYLETDLVAVPKNLVKDFETKYERLSSMVVPRSAKQIAADDDFVLFSVVIFRRVAEEFSQKCRENKFIVRDFSFDQDEIEKAKMDLQNLEEEEKELWADLLRLSRINFSDAFEALVHLKVVRAYIESVLRYGLPASYFCAVVKPAPKQATKCIQQISQLLKDVSPTSRKTIKKKGAAQDDDTAPTGEYATVLEGEYFPFVIFELERVDGSDD